MGVEAVQTSEPGKDQTLVRIGITCTLQLWRYRRPGESGGRQFFIQFQFEMNFDNRREHTQE